MIFNEVWKDIECYEGLYQVSNIGRIKSLKNGKERILKPQLSYKGYYRIALYKKGKGTIYSVHRLVAEGFIPNPNNLPIINHKDENKLNNNSKNLEWCTYSYNSNYGHCKDSVSKKIKVTNLKTKEITIFKSIGEATRTLFNSKRINITECCQGKRKQAKGYKFEYIGGANDEVDR